MFYFREQLVQYLIEIIHECKSCEVLKNLISFSSIDNLFNSLNSTNNFNRNDFYAKFRSQKLSSKQLSYIFDHIFGRNIHTVTRYRFYACLQPLILHSDPIQYSHQLNKTNIAETFRQFLEAHSRRLGLRHKFYAFVRNNLDNFKRICCNNPYKMVDLIELIKIFYKISLTKLDFQLFVVEFFYYYRVTVEYFLDGGRPFMEASQMVSNDEDAEKQLKINRSMVEYIKPRPASYLQTRHQRHSSSPKMNVLPPFPSSYQLFSKPPSCITDLFKKFFQIIIDQSPNLFNLVRNFMNHYSHETLTYRLESLFVSALGNVDERYQQPSVFHSLAYQSYRGPSLKFDIKEFVLTVGELKIPVSSKSIRVLFCRYEKYGLLSSDDLYKYLCQGLPRKSAAQITGYTVGTLEYLLEYLLHLYENLEEVREAIGGKSNYLVALFNDITEGSEWFDFSRLLKYLNENYGKKISQGVGRKLWYRCFQYDYHINLKKFARFFLMTQ